MSDSVVEFAVRPKTAEDGTAKCRRVSLRTGVNLNVAFAGDPANPPVILLHGFPESHRTWRDVAPRLKERFYVVMPDQRGFGGSDKPQGVAAYGTDVLVDDVFALADAVGLEPFALVGHDWGGFVAWQAALRGDPRVRRLAIVDAPHPLIYQKTLIENPEQRAASQYVTAFRSPGFEAMVEAKGFDWFFDTSFAPHVDMAKVTAAERQRYIDDWSQPGAFSAMLNWYRAARFVVPPPGENAQLPDWVLRPFPKVEVPTLVIWGMKDFALAPVQLDGLDALVEDLTIVRLPAVGHFAPWEAGEQVAEALAPFLAADGGAQYMWV